MNAYRKCSNYSNCWCGVPECPDTDWCCEFVEMNEKDIEVEYEEKGTEA